MASKFKELSLDGIDEGRFAKRVQADFRDLQHTMLEYCKTHGNLALKAKGKLQIEISVTCDAPRDQTFSIKALTKTMVPTSPASFNVAMGSDGDDGKPALFVRNSGGTATTPKQGALATLDGKPIDTETGEVAE